MSASPACELDAVTLQLVAALEQYEGDMARMAQTWLDMELYGQVSEEIEQIRAFSGALPQLGTGWVELLIAHAELVHALWRLQFRDGAADMEELAQLRARHAECVAHLRRRCLRLLAQRPAPRP